MENACDAEKVVSAANMNKITVAGKHPKVSVSTKHAHLNKRYDIEFMYFMYLNLSHIQNFEPIWRESGFQRQTGEND